MTLTTEQFTTSVSLYFRSGGCGVHRRDVQGCALRNQLRGSGMYMLEHYIKRLLLHDAPDICLSNGMSDVQYRFFGEVVVQACVDHGYAYTPPHMTLGQCLLCFTRVASHGRQLMAIECRALLCSKTYVDITGEPDFMERMAHMHGVRALETGALVVSSCGFDSIPADVGTEHCVAQFPERNLVWMVIPNAW